GLTRALEHRAVLDQEFLRLAEAFYIAVDLRNHVARDHVPASAGVFRVGPIVHEADDGADAARDLHQILDGFDEVIRRADGRRGVFAAGRLLDRVLRRGERLQPRPLQRADVTFVVPAHQARPRLALRLFTGLGDVP